MAKEDATGQAVESSMEQLLDINRKHTVLTVLLILHDKLAHYIQFRFRRNFLVEQ